MSWNRLPACAVVAGLAFTFAPTSLNAGELWTTRDGTLTLTIPQDEAVALGLFVGPASQPVNERLESPSHARSAGAAGLTSSSASDIVLTLNLAMEAGSDLGFVAAGGDVLELLGLHIELADGLRFATAQGPYSVVSFDILPEGVAGAKHVSQPGYLELIGIKLAFDPPSGRFTLASREVRIPPALAEALGRPELAGASIGRAVVEADARWMGGETPSPLQPGSAELDRLGQQTGLPGRSHSDSAGRGTIGPDMTFCQLYGLRQYGRLGDIVGLSVATTSWNIGNAVLPWFAIPNVNHPFIVMDVYRLKSEDGSERFEQIGQSWIKHGFCAVNGSQCTTSCQSTPCSTLGLGCTDTYTAGLNAQQSGLGPRYEVDPWARAWTYADSHMSQGNHSHGPIDHRIQVHDADLDAAQTPGATYFTGSFYVCPEDVNTMNNAAWKPVTVSGSPGGDWTFGMSGSSVMPEIGFAIDAWEGATQTILAEEVPVVEFVSPDGRCLLAAKTTDLGGAMWHYEYALLNVDMDRKVGSFRIPIDRQAVIENVGFHAVESHDEPYSNDPWTAEIAGGTITWNTTDNPLRWGMLYNFRFDAGVPPNEAVTVTLGLFEPGAPSTVTGTTIGPVSEPPDCNDNGIADACDLDCGPVSGACDVPGCGESADCRGNGIPSECDDDCNGNAAPDECDITGLSSSDCNENWVPDECEWIDCNSNGILDVCDLSGGKSPDCNGNTIPDECDIAGDTSEDCDGNEIPDECETLPDTDGDGVLDCYDLCPETTEEGACECPEFGVCWLNGIPIPDFPRDQCLAMGGLPDCIDAPCHDGCPIGDGDGDGDIDFQDFALFQSCYSGTSGEPGYIPPSEACLFWFSYEDDEDIDPEDYAQMHALQTGPRNGR